MLYRDKIKALNRSLVAGDTRFEGPQHRAVRRNGRVLRLIANPLLHLQDRDIERLAAFEADNAALRKRAVDLALEIQVLRDELESARRDT